MTSYEIIIGAITYDLSNPNGLLVTDHNNFGMPPVEQISSESATQDGAVSVGYRVRPRVIQLAIAAFGDEGDVFGVRDQLLNIFKPSRTPLSLRVTRPDGSLRQIDGYINGGLPLPLADKRGYVQTAGVELFCPDPLWYAPEQHFVVFSIAGGGSGFVVPVTIPSFLGASTIDQTYTIAYAGSYREYPTLEIVGPFTNLVVTNNATGDVIDFTGQTIAAGATYYIDLRPRYKTVVDQAGVNQIAKLTDASDLASFSLEHDPVAAGGLNSIRCVASGLTAASIIYLRYYDRFIGV